MGRGEEGRAFESFHRHQAQRTTTTTTGDKHKHRTLGTEPRYSPGQLQTISSPPSLPPPICGTVMTPHPDCRALTRKQRDLQP